MNTFLLLSSSYDKWDLLYYASIAIIIIRILARYIRKVSNNDIKQNYRVFTLKGERGEVEEINGKQILIETEPHTIIESNNSECFNEKIIYNASYIKIKFTNSSSIIIEVCGRTFEIPVNSKAGEWLIWVATTTKMYNAGMWIIDAFVLSALLKCIEICQILNANPYNLINLFNNNNSQGNYIYKSIYIIGYIILALAIGIFSNIPQNHKDKSKLNAVKTGMIFIIIATVLQYFTHWTLIINIILFLSYFLILIGFTMLKYSKNQLILCTKGYSALVKSYILILLGNFLFASIPYLTVGELITSNSYNFNTPFLISGVVAILNIWGYCFFYLGWNYIKNSDPQFPLKEKLTKFEKERFTQENAAIYYEDENSDIHSKSDDELLQIYDERVNFSSEFIEFIKKELRDRGIL